METKGPPLPWEKFPYHGVYTLPPGVTEWVFPSAFRVVTGEIEILQYKDEAGNEMQAVVVNAKGAEMEDKQNICNLLLKTLQATDNAHDVVSITYERQNDSDELVTVKFASGGYRKINVSMDSGTAMIKDIMKGLGC